jgi:hypothetical protein
MPARHETHISGKICFEKNPTFMNKRRISSPSFGLFFKIGPDPGIGAEPSMVRPVKSSPERHPWPV